MIRSLFDLMQESNEWKSFWDDGHITLYNAVFFLLADFVPIVSQTAALGFGLLRH